MSLVVAEGLRYDHPGGITALCGLDLTVARSRRLAILGPNGAGKTTLLLHLNGTLRPRQGRVLIDGRALGYGRSGLAEWRRRVGLVLQEADDQLFAPSVDEDVSFGPVNLGLSATEIRARVEEALDALDITDLARRPTHMLSFGQKKRVAIAGALAMRPEVLLLDEPTAGLDGRTARHLLAVLERLGAQGTTLVFSTHDVDLAWTFADDVALFDRGSVVGHGRATDLLVDVERLRSIGLTPPLVARVGLAARAGGLLGAEEPLPRDEETLIACLSAARPSDRPEDPATIVTG